MALAARQLASRGLELGREAAQEGLLTHEVQLESGATARLRGEGERAVVCVNGGSGRELPGTWSASLEWLARRLARTFPELVLVEVRYRIRSWRKLDWCIEDGAAAIVHAVAGGAREVALLGFSMGGAVAIANAGHPSVPAVIGLAPWIPDRLDVSPLDGKRLAVLHGSLDAWLPGIPGVSPRHTLRGMERIRARGVETTHRLIGGALHGVAVRAPWGGVASLPRARTWERLVRAELVRFGAQAA